MSLRVDGRTNCTASVIGNTLEQQFYPEDRCNTVSWTNQGVKVASGLLRAVLSPFLGLNEQGTKLFTTAHAQTWLVS